MSLRSRASKFDFDGEACGQAWACEEKLVTMKYKKGLKGPF